MKYYLSFKKIEQDTEEYVKLLRSLQTQQSLPKVNEQEEETMNDNLNTNTTTFKPVPATALTDEDFAKLLETKPIDGEVLGYTTDADEATDEPTPTLH